MSRSFWMLQEQLNSVTASTHSSSFQSQLVFNFKIKRMAQQVLYGRMLCSTLTAHAVEEKLLLVYRTCHFKLWDGLSPKPSLYCS